MLATKCSMRRNEVICSVTDVDGCHPADTAVRSDWWSSANSTCILTQLIEAIKNRSPQLCKPSAKCPELPIRRCHATFSVDAFARAVDGSTA